MPRGSQLSRQWRLLQLLDAPAGVTVEDAARDLDCVVRTIWRDPAERLARFGVRPEREPADLVELGERARPGTLTLVFDRWRVFQANVYVP